MHQSFHRANQATDRRPCGEVPLHPGSGYGAGTGNSCRHPGCSPSSALPQAGLAAVPEHVADLYNRACENCSSSAKRQALARLLMDYSDVFSYGDEDMGLTKVVCHEIPLVAKTTPIRQPTQWLGPEKEKEVSKQVRDLFDRDLNEPAHGAWRSPVVLVKKKDGSWRFCVDYHKLNSVIIHDAYPLPRIDKSLDALAGSKYFSTLDLLSGYWQVLLSPDAQDKAAFIIRDGLWKWKVLPFGPTSASATF